MRTLLKAQFPVDAGNRAITEGKMEKLFEDQINRLRPEATYFYTEKGLRTCLMVFDLKDPSDMPVIAEPLFMEMNATVEFHPVMNVNDLQKGLENITARHGATARR